MNVNTISLPTKARTTKRCGKLEIDGWKKNA
jgi:hypothetical protein